MPLCVLTPLPPPSLANHAASSQEEDEDPAMPVKKASTRGRSKRTL